MKVQEKIAAANSVAEETLGAMHTVRFYASEDQECRNYAKKMDEYSELGMKQAAVYSFYATGERELPSDPLV